MAFQNMTPHQLTPFLNENNVETVRDMIKGKQSSNPYYANALSAAYVVTDRDHFPYTRYYRGVPHSSNPVVYEREAGWRKTNNSCYQINCPKTREPYPNHCWEAACSTVFPCYPQYQQKFADAEALDVQLNKSCINLKYR